MQSTIHSSSTSDPDSDGATSHIQPPPPSHEFV
jgi:hypothetical protein